MGGEPSEEKIEGAALPRENTGEIRRDLSRTRPRYCDSSPKNGPSYRSYFRAFSSAVVNLLPFPWRAGPPSCILLGRKYDLSIPRENDAFLKDFRSRILFTYRSFFDQIEVCLGVDGDSTASCSFLQSIGLAPRGVSRFICDAGWGCMIRVFQMALTETILSTMYGRDWATFHPAADEQCTDQSIIDQSSSSSATRVRSLHCKSASSLSQPRSALRKTKSLELGLCYVKGGTERSSLNQEVKLKKLDAYCKNLADVIGLCRDVPSATFSIHNIVKVGEKHLGKQSGEWFGPTSCAQVISAIINQGIKYSEDTEIDQGSQAGRLTVQGTAFYAQWCDDGVIDLQKITSLFDNNSRQATIILLITLRLGIDSFNIKYQPFLQSCFGIPFFRGLAGGGPLTSAYYFIASNNDYLYFLDPHTMTQPAFKTISVTANQAELQPLFTVNGEEMSSKAFGASFGASSPKQLSWASLNPSMTLIFSCSNEEQLADLMDRLKRIDNEGVIQVESERLRNAHMAANRVEKDMEGYLVL